MEQKKEQKKERNRRVVTKESVVSGFKELDNFIEIEMKRLKESEEKGRQYLRSLAKKIRILGKDTSKVLKIKKPRDKNIKSGIMKPVKITNELAEFTGWDEDGRYSRVEVTRFICGYITEKKLQNPKFKIEIFPDKALGKLLKYDPTKETEPLTYTRIQKLIQVHFIKDTKENVKKAVNVPKGSIKVKNPMKKGVKN